MSDGDNPQLIFQITAEKLERFTRSPSTSKANRSRVACYLSMQRFKS